MDTIDLIQETLSAFNLSILETYKIPSSSATYRQLPDNINNSLSTHLTYLYPDGLYGHQVLAINYGLSGNSFCISTPTASGKTTVFTTLSINKILSNKNTRILALYPAKALIHDQYGKWQTHTKPFGLRTVIIHGGIDKSQRLEIIKTANIILMTPDVLHSWLMTELANPIVIELLKNIGILILDEAHIYDGIFGTNMAYLIRRLRCQSKCEQIISSSATIGDPSGFIKKLTGLDTFIIDKSHNGSYIPEKNFLLSKIPGRQLDSFVNLLINNLRRKSTDKFIVFLDSRTAVEETASSVMIDGANEDESSGDQDQPEEVQVIKTIIDNHNVLPYRSGYEEEDRVAIQHALDKGTLRGVIATSALELGIDIGEISLVVNIGTPTSTKSLWQRAGRAGRKKEGIVFIIDTIGRLTEIGLNNYLSLDPEPNWIYMDNEYLQYANALCSADEFSQSVNSKKFPLEDLPTKYLDYLENELHPTIPIPNELHSLKQQSLMHSHPHFAFPLRSGPDKQYALEIQNTPHIKIGHVNYSQVCQESYPGAIYRYMGQPFRVWKINHSKGTISVQKIKNRFGKTRPIIQNMVFPDYEEIFAISGHGSSFMCECRMQVSSRVVGFSEIYGKNRKTVSYESNNMYSQKPLLNYFDTTGICFYFEGGTKSVDSVGAYIRSAFCRVCSIYERDVGVGSFVSRTHPILKNISETKGFAIFDSTKGSLRLTKMLVENITSVLGEAIRMANQESATIIRDALCEIKSDIIKFTTLSPMTNALGRIDSSQVVDVVLEGQMAICNDGVSIINQEVEIVGFLYTRNGLKYNLKHSDPTVKWQVSQQVIFPIPGITRTGKYNIDTGDLDIE